MAGPDRAKALDTALAQIERQFGKGSVMRLGEEGRAPIEVIPTSSIALDVALGIGGLPRGRVVEVYGPESSGKCLTADTYLWTDQGLETVAELFARCGQMASCTSRTTDVRALGVRLVNERAELEPVAVLTHNNRKPVLRVRLVSGRALTLTKNHPLRVMNDRGSIVWRRAGDLQVGDSVVSAAFGAPEAAEGAGLGEDEAVLLGYLVAEGSLNSRNAVRFTNWDPEVSGEYTQLMERVFGATVVDYYGKEYVTFDTSLRARLAQEYDLDYVNAAGKKVPACVRRGGEKAQRAFLSALFEGDGWIDPTSTVGLGTASEQLAREVQLLLFGLGVPCTVSSSYNKTYERDYWTVTINPSTTHRFLAEVGFRSRRRRDQVTKNFRQGGREPQLENVPHLQGLLRDLRDDAGGDRTLDRLIQDLLRADLQLECSRQRLAKVVAWCEQRETELPATSRGVLAYLRFLVAARYTYEQVVSIEDAGVQPTFDVMLPKTHSFLANGMLSHNTTVALHAVANAQRAGGIAAFIDAEHALDPEYAQKLGVDTDALLVSQPDTGEQALEIADMLIRSGALDNIVIDSVAALVPRAEIEGEMGDSHVGLQARLMSQALRKLTGALSSSRTTAVFINQLREKVGVLFGSPETTSGGRALKFYASVRLDVRRIETLKDGTEAVGNRTRVKVVKNKCLAGSTQVFDPVSGVTHRLDDIVKRRLPMHVTAVDKVGQMHVRPVTSWFDQGEQDVVRVRIKGGFEITATPDHRFLTERGWVEAGQLLRSDRVARPREMRGFGSDQPDSAGEALHLSSAVRKAVLAHLRWRGLTGLEAARLIGREHEGKAGLGTLLGASRLRRDRVEALAHALDDAFLREVLSEQLTYAAVMSVEPAGRERTYDLEVDELHNLVANGMVVHNCAPPFKQAEFDILYGQGISREGGLIDMGVEHGFVRKSGAWYTYEGDQLGQGKENARAFLRDNPDLANEIEKRIKEKLGVGPRVDVPAEPPAAPVDF